jgi:SAM-dependent methyltransferase
VGCGNGALVIRLAQKYPEAKVTGIDYWGTMWEYSKKICERNARVEGVARQVIFQNASGSALPFKDGSFDVVISNLAFHEVRDTKDKREVIREALRVVKKGGRFVFQDLFLLRRIYGQIDDLVAAVKSMGITRVEFVRTGNASSIPKILKLPAMVGALGILFGEKWLNLFRFSEESKVSIIKIMVQGLVFFQAEVHEERISAGRWGGDHPETVIEGHCRRGSDDRLFRAKEILTKEVNERPLGLNPFKKGNCSCALFLF